MDYPDNCIRGVPNNDFIQEDLIRTHLFHFEERDAREDGLVEQSINWQDNDDVIIFTLNQKKENDEVQFKTGVVIVPRTELERIRQKFSRMGVFSYERQPLDGNPYHGNLLLRLDMVKKPIMKQIASTLALYSEFIPREGIETQTE